MKIILLDIDGPLQTHRVLAAQQIHWCLTVKLDPISVQLLDKVCNLTGAKIVLCSTWRHAFGITQTMAYLYMYGLDARKHFFQWSDLPDQVKVKIELAKGAETEEEKHDLRYNIVGTPRGRDRSAEIQAWLDLVDAPAWITHKAIIEDAHMSEELRPYWVDCSGADGYCFAQYQQTLQLLDYHKEL